MRKANCCKCGNLKEPKRINQGYCASCQLDFARKHRRYSDLSPIQRKKEIARASARIYKRYGVLKSEPCIVCGSLDTEFHHEDYEKPLDVKSLCRKCHLNLHYQKETA